MVSPAPSSESSYVVRMDDEYTPTPGVEVQEQQSVNTFDLGDGDFKLWVNGSLFMTHAYLLKKFTGFKYLVKSTLESEGTASKSSKGIRIQRDDQGVEDFQNMFKVLYASVVDGPFEFDPPTLISALRIATAYDHPNLRSFAIKHLESIPLSAIERISLSREFGLTSWEGPAYIELCERDEAINKEEASVLGIDAFVHVAKIREVEQRRRGRVVDAAEPAQEDDISSVQADEELSPTGNKTPGLRKKSKSPKKKPAKSAASSQNTAGETPTVDISKLSFIGIPTPSVVDTKQACGDSKISQHFEVPGCECKGVTGSHGGKPCPCRVSPCVYEAIKALQTQQAAHTANMHNLEETVQEIEDRHVPISDAISTPSLVVTPVSEQVMKWLSSVRA